MRYAVALLMLGLSASPAIAADSMGDMAMPGMAMAADSPSAKAFKAADDKMMKDMGQKLTGDADKDFVAGMIPHHQGAIDMAAVELTYGKNPALRQLASDIIAAQEKEIAFMKKWQTAHGN